LIIAKIGLVEIWNFANANAVAGLVFLLIGILITDVWRRHKNKCFLLSLLKRDLKKYYDPLNKIAPRNFQMNVSPGYINHILMSGLLHISRDKELIHQLHELSCYINNFNEANEFANQALATGNEFYDQFDEGRDILFNGLIDVKDTVLKHLSEKYKL